MKKSHVFMAIIFYLIGSVYASVFYFVLGGENPQIHMSIMQGLFVGIISAANYIMIFAFWGIIWDDIDLHEAGKKIRVSINVITMIILWIGITMFISGEKTITLPYAWMHIVNLLFTMSIFCKANYDAKVLKKSKTE